MSYQDFYHYKFIILNAKYNFQFSAKSLQKHF